MHAQVRAYSIESMLPSPPQAVHTSYHRYSLRLSHIRIWCCSIRENEIRADGAQVLAGALRAATSLSTLQLGHNNLGGFHDRDGFTLTPEGPKAICNALAANKSLTVVGLNHNLIGGYYDGEDDFVTTPSGPSALAQMLRTNCTLTEVCAMARPIEKDARMYVAPCATRHMLKLRLYVILLLSRVLLSSTSTGTAWEQWASRKSAQHWGTTHRCEICS